MTALIFDSEGRPVPNKINQVWIQIKRPSGSFPGQSCLGYYTIEDDTVVMTDAEGQPARDGDGKYYRQTLKPGENPKVIAGRLTRELRLALRGGKNAPVAGFDGPIIYPKGSVV
jgi:hypothetical protein